MLAAPQRAKHVEDSTLDKNDIAWTVCSMQGWRIRQEDRHLVLRSVASSGPWMSVSLFGVFDGHGGPEVAEFVAKHLAEELVATSMALKTSSSLTRREIASCLTAAFLALDERLRTTEARKELIQLRGGFLNGTGADNVGATIVVCCIRGRDVVIASAGDARAVLAQGGRAVALTKDHKPEHPAERRRIVASGGRVECLETVHRVCVDGNAIALNLSRSIGDLVFKANRGRSPNDQIITAVPAIVRLRRKPEHEFILLACDGIWEVVSSEAAVEFVRQRLPRANDEPAATALESLFKRCLSSDPVATKGLGCDNMTAILLRFQDCKGGGSTRKSKKRKKHTRSRRKKQMSSSSSSSSFSSSSSESSLVSPKRRRTKQK